ncbi:MAG: hypothetical protein ACOCUR_00855 [Nanoarchaeota archaeon]
MAKVIKVQDDVSEKLEKIKDEYEKVWRKSHYWGKYSWNEFAKEIIPKIELKAKKKANS